MDWFGAILVNNVLFYFRISSVRFTMKNFSSSILCLLKFLLSFSYSNKEEGITDIQYFMFIPFSFLKCLS